MSVIYAKLKRNENPTVILFGEQQSEPALEQLFNPVSLDNSIEYDCNGIQLTDDEVFHVDLSEEQWSKVQAVFQTNNTSTADLNNSGYSDQYGNIDVIYRVTDEAIAFKKIYAFHLVGHRGFVAWGDRPSFIAPTDKVSIDGRNDLYIDKTTKRAYFKSFTQASRVASVLLEFYFEATEQETTDVLANDIFDVSELDIAEVKQRNRKRIALITNELGIDLSDAGTVTKIKAYADKYSLGDVFNDDKLKVASNTELTKALDVISGAFYKNEITDDVMKATATKKI